VRTPEPCLRVFLLGPAFVEWQARRLDVPRRQARALLHRLAAQAEPTPREVLCFTFWPDVPETESKRRLSHLITQLRQTLPLPGVLRARNELVDLDPALIWTDAIAFANACEKLDPESRSPQPALELYRGPFLSGFTLAGCPEFNHWVSEQRTHFQRLYLEALTGIIHCEAGRANYNRAILYCRRYLRVNELAEDVHRQLMTLHMLSGDRPAALQQYRRFVTVLDRDLGIEPLPETKAVYTAIMNNRIPG
jgi:DNA-binding SARP family transcriptional activator